MTIATISKSTLLQLADTNYANTGTIGYVALLKADLTTGLTVTADSGTDIITASSPHGLTTGSRFRLASTGTVPSPLSAAIDYYAIVLSATTIKVAATQDDALAGSPVAINLTDAGTGTITQNEQELNVDDPLTVLLAKELTHPAWTARGALSALGAAAIVSGNAEKSKMILVPNTDPSTLTYKHALVMLGAGVAATIGSIPTGTVNRFLVTETTPQSVANGELKNLIINLRVKPA